jgi:hypothetical protein
MEYFADTTIKAALLDKIAKREFKVRTGCHCSDLLYCLNKSALRRLCPKQPTENQLLTYSIGWATQRWLTGKDEDQPERVQDGIIVTLDAVCSDINDRFQLIPWELKATFTSSTRPIEENTPWMRQIMAQCHVLNTTEAVLSRLELMGNWKSIFGKSAEKSLPENEKPTLSVMHFIFTHGELEMNWNWLLQRSAMFREILETKTILPKVAVIPSGQEYECGKCEYKEKECTV